MAKQKKKFAKCPSCNTNKHKTEMEYAVSDMTKLEKKTYKYYKELKIDSYGTFIDSDFEWACDACLDSKKAIKANLSSQDSSSPQHFAYFDTSLTCRKCQAMFIFSKDEKKFWYEGLKFRTESIPVNCTNCRKEVRQLKLENKTLSDILKKEEKELSKEELNEIVNIYAKWQKTEREKYFRSLLKKKK